MVSIPACHAGDQGSIPCRGVTFMIIVDVIYHHHTFVEPTLGAFVAQWLEHWSCKPGVESSNLSEGFWWATPDYSG